MNVQEQNVIELLNGLGLKFSVRFDLRDTNIRLGDYIKLHGLELGDIIFCSDGNSTIPLFIGNCTPHHSPMNSGPGWDCARSNHLRVLAIYSVSLECGSMGEISPTAGFEKI